jgi:ABC-2 type transport system ATP-binding protein
MLHQGKLVLCGRLDEIKLTHRRLTLRFDDSQTRAPSFPGALKVTGAGREWTVISNQEAPTGIASRVIDEDAATLDEIFIAYAGVFPS